MKNNMSIAIFADATPQIGAGHVMRCLALAEFFLSKQIPCSLCGEITLPWVVERIKALGINFFSLSREEALAENLEARLRHLAENEWVILDGYHFTNDSQLAIQGEGHKLVVIDDYAHLESYSADILLNQNLDSEMLDYSGDIKQKLFGSRYVLLRSEFMRDGIKKKVFSQKANNILLNLGGGNILAYLPKILDFLEIPSMRQTRLRVVSPNIGNEEILKALKSCPTRTIEIRKNPYMPSLYSWADLCICSASGSCWELCHMGIPFVTVVLADNQRIMANGLKRLGIPILESPIILSDAINNPDIRKDISTIGMSLCDGNGVQRLVGAMLQDNLQIREATEADCAPIFRLIDDEEVRKQATHPHIISWDEHRTWYEKRIRKLKTPFYLACNGNDLVGYVRFDLMNEIKSAYYISIVVSKKWRRCGLGTLILHLACGEFFKSHNCDLQAQVHEKNKASIRLFEKAGFHKESCENLQEKFLRFTYKYFKNPGNKAC